MAGNFAINYERLASAELEVAKSVSDETEKSYHLNKAAVFAYLCDDQRQGQGKSVDKVAIVEVLQSLLKVVDSLGETMAAIHIDAALVALGDEPPHDK